jgi:uncharacterized protein YaaN involved in tellurite resistance
MTQSNELAIDFGSIVGARADAPTGSADAALSKVVSSGPPGRLVCVELLSPAQRGQAETLSQKLFPAMLADTDQLATFGSTAIEQVNAQVNRIFREVGPVDIPELTQIMHEVNDRMRDFRRKYDPADPKVREAFDRVMDAVKGLFRRGRDMLQMLLEDARTVERQLDKIAGTLAEKQQQLKRNVVLCDELYQANESAIGQLVGAIAVMELVRDAALAEARSIVIDPAAADRREREEYQSRVTEFIQAIEVRINEYQQRLFVAWSTSPQVRNIRTLNYGLGQRLALLVNLTIPTMKLTIAQWGLLLQANQAGEMQAAVADGANDVLSAYASAAGTAVPKIAAMIQTPTIRPETIMEVAASIDAQAKGIEAAVRYGQQRRIEVVSAIVAAQHSMSDSSQKLNQAVTDLVARAQRPLEQPPAPALPEAVVAQARGIAAVPGRAPAES